MTGDPIHRFFGTTASEWIKNVPNELDVDAVGLWQIIPVGREDFGLSGDALQEFTKSCIEALLKSGACPVRPSTEKNNFWVHDTTYGRDPTEVAENIINEWGQTGEDPDQDGLWFARI